jgi:hypothetical protein
MRDASLSSFPVPEGIFFHGNIPTFIFAHRMCIAAD